MKQKKSRRHMPAAHQRLVGQVDTGVIAGAAIEKVVGVIQSMIPTLRTGSPAEREHAAAALEAMVPIVARQLDQIRDRGARTLRPKD